MNKNYFEIIRAGINTTFQDGGRSNLYHIGIPFSGGQLSLDEVVFENKFN